MTKHFIYTLIFCSSITAAVTAQTTTPFLTLGEGNSTGDGTFIGVTSYSTQPCYTKSFALEHHFYGYINSSVNFLRGGGMTGGFLTFNTNDNSEKMRIDVNGNVGIGTTNPDEKLTVNGVIHAKEVKVDLSGPLADFVFKPNYKLMSLPQVEQFVKANNRLPQMPSANEVAKNGLSMGEMQNKLLQKVEELTLYAIEMKKEINVLKEENKRIRTQLDRK